MWGFPVYPSQGAEPCLPLVAQTASPEKEGSSVEPSARGTSGWLNRGEPWFQQKLIGLRPNVALGENNLQ